jgi:hypothetical protein
VKPGTPALRSPRLLDQVRERIRYLHYSLSTEKLYVYWIRFFIRWHGREGQMHHPRDIAAPGIEAFLTMLATERKARTDESEPPVFSRRCYIGTVGMSSHHVV